MLNCSVLCHQTWLYALIVCICAGRDCLCMFSFLQNLRIQKRLSAAVLKCGKNRVFLDPAVREQRRLASATSRDAIRKLIKERVILRKPTKGQCRARVNEYRDAKREGRHMGLGKRRGTKNARMPTKVLWMRRQRVLRRLLRKYREQKKIDRTTYHTFYLRAKGNQFRNKRVLIEAIWDAKNEQNKERALAEQRDARKAKAAAKKERKAKAAEAKTAEQTKA